MTGRFAGVIGILGAALMPTASQAFFCSEPSKPYCLEGYGFFSDQWELDSCRSEVESYVSDVEEYVQCLEDEQNEKIESANEAIERFNCRARGDNYC